MAREKDLSTDDKFELLIEALTARKTEGIDADTLRTILSETQSASADAMKKALKPENESHPGKSALSYPEGDRAKPREGILPHEFFYNGFPVSKFPETHHYRELELAAQVEPGEYAVMRKDTSLMTVVAKGERDAKGTLTRMEITFPISRDEKWLVPPMAVVLSQMANQDVPLAQRFMAAMQEWLSMQLEGQAA